METILRGKNQYSHQPSGSPLRYDPAADVLLGRDEYGMRYIKACHAKRS
jgi:hypothetical protein